MSRLSRLAPYLLSFASSLFIMTLELVASRLVARHVGASLHVWTSVIGIVLGGICLGNVLGGRLSDRMDPRRAIGPLFALGSALTLGCLWMNAVVGRLPGLEYLPWSLRSLVVVTLDFLVTATVIGMIGPVVARMAVDQSARAGSAVGDVYFWGAVGSIVGTFVAGFFLMYEATTTTIVTVVAAGLALLAAGTLEGWRSSTGRPLAVAAAVCLAVGSIGMVDRAVPAISLGGARVNLVVLVGHLLSLLTAIAGVGQLRAARRDELARRGDESLVGGFDGGERPRLRDLAALAFLISLSFMALEMVAGRLVTRHLGSSIYGWTSIIGVLLGGLSLGNLLGGKIADRITGEKQASWLFLAASIMTLWILLAESPPRLIFGEDQSDSGSLLSNAINMAGIPWGLRIVVVVTLVFFLPAVTMGTVSPIVAKLAIDRLRRRKRTGTAIGTVYAWGMLGSILGTFLAGFVLIDVLGTKGLVLALATVLAISATVLGSIWHAAWAGIPLGLCLLAFIPLPWLASQGVDWGVREQEGDPETAEDALAHVDESNYYYIKITNEQVADPGKPDDENATAMKRTIVLDNLIHGYFLLGHPEHLEYDYEYIYAQVSDRVAEAKAARGDRAPLRSLFLGGGAYTFPRYLQHTYPGAECDVAEIDPAVKEANHLAMGLPRDTTIQTHLGDARQYVEREAERGGGRFDLVFGDAFNDFSVPWHLTTKEFNDRIARLMTDDGVYMINIIDVYQSDDEAVHDSLAERQVEVIAGALRAAGNDAEGSESLARGLRTAWRDQDLGLDVDGVSGVAIESLPRDAKASVVIEDLAGRLRTIDRPFRGDDDRLAAMALDTLARAQAQRDQTAAADAARDYLREQKAVAAVAALKEAGIRFRAGGIADRLVESWFGGEESMEDLLEQLDVDGDRSALAKILVARLDGVESRLKESPVLLGRRAVLSANEVSKASTQQLARARSPEVIAEKLRGIELGADAEPLAALISRRLAEVSIKGGLPEIAKAATKAARGFGSDPDEQARIVSAGLRRARGLGAFLGSWVNTARKTFPAIHVFGTDKTPGNGLRETFVVVAAKKPIDVSELGRRAADATFVQDEENFEPDPYSAEHLKALDLRSRGIVLTDEYAPVENLLAPVAATRGEG